jgi:predicted glycoside hydrolase/deacetylase ChbG (UPF0249 family)
MVFMKSSQFAAEVAAAATLETGLHLNFTLPFDSPEAPSRLKEFQLSILSYLCSTRWARALYNPLLKRKFEYAYQMQYQEYCRLYGKEPEKIDGHHHMHLCMNMVVNRIIPSGQRVRRNLSFKTGEKNVINRSFRKTVDAWLVSRYCCTDLVFGIEHLHERRRQNDIIHQACSLNVELVVHPGNAEEYDYLTNAHFRHLVAAVPKGTYSMLSWPRPSGPKHKV